MVKYKLENGEELKKWVDQLLDLIKDNTALKSWAEPDTLDDAEGSRSEMIDTLEKLRMNYNSENPEFTLPSRVEVGEIWESYFLKCGCDKPWDFFKGEKDLPLKDRENRPIGYSRTIDGADNALLSSTLLYRSSLIQHYYSDKDNILPVDLDVKSVIQGSGNNEQKFYIGSATAAELDAISKVPDIPEMESAKFGHKVLKRQMKSSEWQRKINTDRIKKIREFIDEEDSYVFNPVILYVDLNNEHVKELGKLNGKGKLRVNFSFLQKRGERFTDYAPKPGKEDTRPFWIIDGQHRIRGIGSSYRGSKLQIPFVLIVGKGGPDKIKQIQSLVAKIFTEINTLGEPLNELHQIHLLYKFGIKGKGKIRDFTIKGVDKNNNLMPTEDSRPQRRAYELALFMASQDTSPLYNLIEFQSPPKVKGRTYSKHHLVTNAKKWIDITSKYYKKDGIYEDAEEFDKGTPSVDRLEIFNFFKAFEKICGKDNWKDGKPRWKAGLNKNKPLLQQSGPFTVLLSIFSQVVKLIVKDTEHLKRPISIETFEGKLIPLKRVDWLATGVVRGKLQGRTNNNIRHLDTWIMTTIKSGYSGTIEEILSKNERSIIGKGLLSRPERPEIKITSNNKWPGTAPLELEVSWPIHSIGFYWVLKHFKGEDGEKERIEASKLSEANCIETKKDIDGNMVSKCVLPSGFLSEYDCDRLEVSAIAFNAIDEAEITQIFKK